MTKVVVRIDREAGTLVARTTRGVTEVRTGEINRANLEEEAGCTAIRLDLRDGSVLTLVEGAPAAGRHRAFVDRLNTLLDEAGP